MSCAMSKHVPPYKSLAIHVLGGALHLLMFEKRFFRKKVVEMAKPRQDIFSIFLATLSFENLNNLQLIFFS